jgi:S-adenosylmethionine-dependent methyltransferase
LLPFFHWLPDDLAFAYSQYSPRPSFAKEFRERNEAAWLRFLRQGRGVSFHEFVLALDCPAERLPVVSCRELRLRRLRLLRRCRWPQPLELQYARLLHKIYPQLHPGFLQPNLDLVFQPNATSASTDQCT